MRVSSYKSDFGAPSAILKAVITYTVGTPDPLSGEPLQKGRARTSLYDDLTLSPLTNARPLIPEMPEMTPDETEAEVKKLVKEITNGMHSGENEHWIFAPEAGTAVKRVIFVFGVPMWDGVNSGKCCFTLCPMATRLLKESSKDLNGTAIVVLNPAVSRLEKAKEVSYPGEDAWYSSLDSAVAEDEASILACVEAINPSVDEIMKKFDVEPENTYFVGRKGTGGLAAASALSRPEKFGGVFLLDSPLVNRRKIANGDIPTNKETPVHLILTSDCSKGLMAITEVVLKAKGVPVTHSFKKADSFESEVDVLKEAFLK